MGAATRGLRASLVTAIAFSAATAAHAESALDQLERISGGSAPSVPQPGAPERVSPQPTRAKVQARPSPQAQMAQSMFEGFLQGLLQGNARAEREKAELERQKAAAAARAETERKRKAAFAVRQFKQWETQAAESRARRRRALGEPGAPANTDDESVDDILADLGGPGDPDNPPGEQDNADILAPAAAPAVTAPQAPPADEQPAAAAAPVPPPRLEMPSLAAKAATTSTDVFLAGIFSGPAMPIASVGRVAVTTAVKESLLNALVKIHNAPGKLVSGAGAAPWGREDAVEFLETVKHKATPGERAVWEWLGF